MKKTFKYLVNYLLCVSFIISLFLFPVLAEVPTSYTLDDSNLSGLLNYPDLDLSTDIVYIGNNGRIQIISPRFGSVTVANNEVKYTGKRIEYDGIKWNDVNANGTVTLGFSWGGLIFLNIPNQQKFCKVVSNASSVPDCINQLTWSADFNVVLSDPYIAYLVGVAKNSLIDEWYIKYSLIQSINPTSSLTVQYFGYKATFGLYNSDNQLLDSIVSFQSDGLSCDSSGNCRVHTSYNNNISSKVVLQSNWLDKSGLLEVNDSKGNSLIESGNSSSQSVSNSINSTNNQLDSAVNSYDEIERELTDNFKVSVDAIDTNFSWGSGFLNSATFIRSCFDNLVEPEPIYNLLLFALILGFSLFIIGRLR